MQMRLVDRLAPISAHVPTKSLPPLAILIDPFLIHRRLHSHIDWKHCRDEHARFAGSDERYAGMDHGLYVVYGVLASLRVYTSFFQCLTNRTTTIHFRALVSSRSVLDLHGIP